MENMFDKKEDVFSPTPEFVFKLEEGEKVYDDAFVVRKTRYGLYNSVGVDGRRWVTAMTEEACVYGTRFNLKAEIDGTLWTGDNVSVMGKAVVGGKL
jgi:hypothetical protein